MLIYVVFKFYVITFLFHLTWENSLFCKVLQFDENLCLADSSYMPPLLLVEYFVRRVHPWTCPHCLVTRLTLFCCYVFFFFFFFQEEQPIYDAFSQEEFLSKFISFLSLEDRKGKDKFNVHRFVLFKVREEISVFGYVLNNK